MLVSNECQFASRIVDARSKGGIALKGPCGSITLGQSKH